jgi:hypothetical protein
MFEHIPEAPQLALIDLTRSTSGVVILRYAAKEPTG